MSKRITNKDKTHAAFVYEIAVTAFLESRGRRDCSEIQERAIREIAERNRAAYGTEGE